MPVAELPHLPHGIRHPHRVRDHNRLGLGAQRRFDPFQGRHIGTQFNIDENRHCAVLDDGIDRRRKARGHRNHLISRLDLPVLKLGRGERRERDEVGGRAGVDQQRVLQTKNFRQARLKLLGIPARCQPEIERGIDELGQFFRIKMTPGITHEVFARTKGSLRLGRMVLAHEIQNLAPQGIPVAHKTGAAKAQGRRNSMARAV